MWLGTVCCWPELRKSWDLADLRRRGVQQDHSILAGCRDRLESEAMLLRELLGRSDRRVVELEVLVVALADSVGVDSHVLVRLASFRSTDAPLAAGGPLVLRDGNPFDDLCAEASSSVTSQAAMDSSCLEPQAWPFCASLCCTGTLLVSSSDDVLYEKVAFV